MNELQVFNNPDFGSLDILWEDGKPLFRAVPVAEMLGYQKPHDAIQRHCRYSVKRGVPHPQNPSKEIEVIFIPESDLYRLITHSKLPSAQKFESWVFDDVLPSIRKNGLYATDELLNNPDLIIKIATELKNERQLRQSAEKQNLQLQETIDIKNQQIAELKPKADYYEVILNCKDAVAVTTIAADYGKSAQWLNKLLESLNVQYKLKGRNCWVLKQPYKGFGYTVTKTEPVTGKEGKVHSFVHTYWTQKGRLFIYDLLKKYGWLPVCERTF